MTTRKRSPRKRTKQAPMAQVGVVVHPEDPRPVDIRSLRRVVEAVRNVSLTDDGAILFEYLRRAVRYDNEQITPSGVINAFHQGQRSVYSKLRTFSLADPSRFPEGEELEEGGQRTADETASSAYMITED